MSEISKTAQDRMVRHNHIPEWPGAVCIFLVRLTINSGPYIRKTVLNFRSKIRGIDLNR